MHPFLVLSALQENFKDYVLGKYPWREGEADHETLARIISTKGEVFQDPVIQLERRRLRAPALTPQEPACFTPVMRKALQQGFPPRREGAFIPFTRPFSHQRKAWERIARGDSTVVSTGTGSGKSESFMFPVLDRVVRSLLERPRSSSEGKVRAIVVYPMNALLEDQHIRLCRYASQLPVGDQGQRVRVGVYNGSFNEYFRDEKAKVQKKSEWKKGIFGDDKGVKDADVEAITTFLEPNDASTYPDVLLTNYSMLQYMLLRKKEHGILAGAQLQALVLDEAHLYSGTLGLEVAGLLARLRVHIEATGGSLAACVPVATSATLVRGSAPEDIRMMADFFQSLFAKPFTDDWLIRDEFEPASEPSTEFWRDLVLPLAVAQLAPAAVRDFGSTLASIPSLRAQVADVLPRISTEIPSVLLRDADASAEAELESVVSLDVATRRYAFWREGGQPATTAPSLEGLANELMGLLTLLSVSPRTSEAPLLGVRLHAFAKSEPRLYRRFRLQGTQWTKQELVDESKVTPAYRLQAGAETLDLPAAFCKNCGHEGWILTAAQRGDHTLSLRQLDRSPRSDDHVIVLHESKLIGDDLSKDWQVIYMPLEVRDGELVAGSVSMKKKGKGRSRDAIASVGIPGDGVVVPSATFSRVRRFGKPEDGEDAKVERPDHLHCPSCLRTNQKEQMRVGRGSPYVDLSVHARALLSSVESEDERRLLIFCDNRQDTSFLAGFLTDRHKRFRLRRALCQLLAEASTDGAGALDVYDEGTKEFPLAQRLLAHMKVQAGESSAHDEVLPQTLRRILPSDVFNFTKDYKSELKQNEGLQLFLRSIDPTSHVRALEGDKGEARLNNPIALRRNGSPTQEGRESLLLLTEAALRDLCMVQLSDGSLPSLGLAALWHDALDKENLPGRYLAWRLFQRLSESALWSVKHTGLEDTGRFARAEVKKNDIPRLVEAITSPETALGRQFRAEEPELARQWGLLGSNDDAPDGTPSGGVSRGFDALLREWHRAGFIVVSAEGRPALVSAGLNVRSSLVRHVSSLRRKATTCVKGFPLAGLHASNRDGDLYGPAEEFHLPKAWHDLYLEPGEVDAFVRAHEHNAMIGNTAAATVIRAFGEKDPAKRSINTVVATPTLEMGIDLPDLPAVVHKSVPPDPSNYAQRSGRAGRDKRRAFILAHCGRGPHDQGYFQDPKAMVAGEITPPGCPRENTFILKRHAMALGLQVLASRECDLESWDSFVDRSPWFARLKAEEVDISHWERAERPPVFAWRETLKICHEELEGRVHAFVEQLKAGLWGPDLGFALTSSIEDLARTIVAVFTNGEFERVLEKALGAYRDEVRSRFEKYDAARSLPDKRMFQERSRQMAYLRSLLGVSAKRDGATLRPIPWLQLHGLLPNFDFPTETAIFTGLRESNPRRQEVAIRFARGLSQAMKEFAPEQNIYAAGHVFRVTRYRVARNVPNLKDNFGVCSQGCSRITKASRVDASCDCGAPLITADGAKKALPPLFQLREAEGEAREFIGDMRAEREQDRLVREALIVDYSEGELHQAPQGGKLGTTRISLHQRRTGQGAVESGLLDLLTVVGGTSHQRPSQCRGRELKPLYADSDDAEEFRVTLTSPKDATNKSEQEGCVHPFLLGHRFPAEGMRFTFDLSGMPMAESLTQPRTSQAFYSTFQAVLLKAIRRVLFLGPRSHALAGLKEVKMTRTTEGEYHPDAIGFLLFDSVPGGSGLFSLVRHYWHRICAKASELVKACPSSECPGACKHCIASYDNQFDHAALDRATLLLGDDSTVFDALGDAFAAESPWEVSQPRHNVVAVAEEDDKAKAEQAFRDLIASVLPNVVFQEQVSLVNSTTGREVTRPDFLLELEGHQVAVFVDGYSYHGDVAAFRADVHKRNFVELCKEVPWVTIPARSVLGGGSNPAAPEVRDLLLSCLQSKAPEPLATKRSTVSVSDEEFEMPEHFEQYEKLLELKFLKLADGTLEAGLKVLRILGCSQSDGRLLCELPEEASPEEGTRLSKETWHDVWSDVASLQCKRWRVVLLAPLKPIGKRAA